MRITAKPTTVVAGFIAALSVSGLIGVPATAGAMPISNLASECRQANGGSWVVDYNGARQVVGYMCFWRDNEGNGYVDYYDRRGNYRNTS